MERLPTDKSLTPDERERAFNDDMKRLTRTISKNLHIIVCVFVLILPILMIWVEMGKPVFSTHMLSDALLRVFMFIVAEHCMLKVGASAGKQDEEHQQHRTAFLELQAQTFKAGTLLLEPFCEWQIDKEFLQAKKTACRRLGIKYEEYEERYRHMSKRELRRRLGAGKGLAVFAINKMKPIELTPELLISDGVDKYARGGVSKSGEAFMHGQMYGKLHLGFAVFAAVCTILPNFQNVDQITWASVVTAFVNIIAVVWRMGTGYANGVRAYNVVEVKHLQSKIKYLQIYREYLQKKIYLRFGDKYGDITELLAHEQEEDYAPLSCEQLDEKRA